ncbi:MAG TPA: GDSL-type esterase/lipase family protein [Phycisphaerae bacterium]|nr:GDSL-type esterase/lipase family protein [Phycisphaerae bacterium]
MSGRCLAASGLLVLAAMAGAAAAKPEVDEVLLTVRETGGLDRKGWPVSCGIPFSDKILRTDAIKDGRFRLVGADGKAVPCQADVAATWGSYPAGSNGFAKWVHLHFLADVPAGQTRQYRFEYGDVKAGSTQTGLKVDDAADSVTITTGSGAGALRLLISKRRCNILDEVWLDVDGDGFSSGDRLVSPREPANLWVDYDHRTARINSATPEVTVEKAGPVLAVVRIRTRLDARFESVVRIFAYAGSTCVRVQETLIHGPTGQDRSAVQSQAVVMKSHALELPISLDPKLAAATMGVGEALPEPATFQGREVPLNGAAKATLEQDLSHPCIKGNVGSDGLSKAFHYRVWAGDQQVHEGRRAPGWMDVSDDRWGITAAVRGFWQTFPKRLVACPDRIRLEHWAAGAQLEPLSRNYNWMGMAKTHDVWLYFHTGDAATAKAEKNALGHLFELFATCEPAYYCATQAYGHQPLTPAVQNGKQMHPEHDKLLTLGLNRERTVRDGFYYFREREDDYGYFNFGDFMVGDYWGCQEYDPSFCMLQQFYRTGELRYLEFAAECARSQYDILYSHTHTPETSNYPQRSHDKSGSHFAGEDSHGQRCMDTDPGHVFIAGLANYWFLTADPRAHDVITWSLPIYLAEDWYRITGGGTWRYLGGYLWTVMTYAYELTWDDRYVEPMIWAAREYMVNNWSRHRDGIWWNRERTDDYICQPWLADSITNGYTQLLEVYPGYAYRPQIEAAIANLADFLLSHSFTDQLDGLHAQLTKRSADSCEYVSTGSVYRKSMGNMAVLTLARAYHLTGAGKYLIVIGKILARVAEQARDLNMLKPVAQGTYYAPMVLPYLEGAIQPRDKQKGFATVEPVSGWLTDCRQLASRFDDRSGTIFLGDELAAACAPPTMRGRSFGNESGWRLSEVLGAVDDLLKRHRPRYAVVLLGGSDLASGHPERLDFEANYTQLVGRIRAAGSIPVCVTLPPCSHMQPFAWIYNAVIYQAAKLNRVPSIDLAELMRGQGLQPVNNEPSQAKVPPAEWLRQNRFARGHEAVVTAELTRVIRSIESP